MKRRKEDIASERPFIETLPPLDIARYKDPEYLALWRQFATWTLNKHRDHPEELADIRKWIAKYAKTKNGVTEGILLSEEIQHVINHNLVYPFPWNAARAKIDVPDNKYDSLNGLFNLSIPLWAEQGATVGLASGVFDILHAGHILFLQECRKQCDVLVVGVDENSIVSRVKGVNRPFNDFSLRVGTLSELPSINFLCSVPELSLLTSPSFIPYMTYFYDLPKEQISKYLKRKEISQQKNPQWYENIGPNLRFFITEGDPATEMKAAGADYMGAHIITIPRFTTLSTSKIADHFDLQPSTYKPGRFGKNPWWISQYLNL